MIRIGVIGAGHWGPNLISNFSSEPRSEVTRVADFDASRLEAVASRFPSIETTTDPLAVIRANDVDAVVIATPTTTHYELARATLEAGKHVLVEKPITARVDEAERLCELAERTDRVLMVGHVFLYNEAAQQAKEYLLEGHLGCVYYISMVRTNLGPIRADVNAAWDLAAHDISLANYWLDAEPEAVSAMGEAWINSGVEDVVFATLRYPNDVLVHLHASWLHPRKTRDITIVGDKRMLTFDDVNAEEPLRIYDKYVTEDRYRLEFIDSLPSFRMMVNKGQVTVPAVSGKEPLRSECGHFLDCIHSGDSPYSDGPHGLAVVRALDAITRSMGSAGHCETLVRR